MPHDGVEPETFRSAGHPCYHYATAMLLTFSGLKYNLYIAVANTHIVHTCNHNVLEKMIECSIYLALYSMNHTCSRAFSDEMYVCIHKVGHGWYGHLI